MSRESPISPRMALTLTLELWRWLADNPGKYKQEWPGWERGEEATANCFCCAYVGDRDRWCDICPLLNHAWEFVEGDEEDEPCMQDSSPYSKWIATGHESHWAMVIVDATVKALKALDKQEAEEKE